MNNRTEIIEQLGKIPPQSTDMEENVICAALIDRDCMMNIIDLIRPECFYKSENEKIFSAIIGLYNSDKKIDIFTVTEELTKRKQLEEVGGPFRIAELSSKLANSAHVEEHARTLVEKFVARQFIYKCNEITKIAFDNSTDMDDLISFAESGIFSINEGLTKKEPKSLKESMPKTYESLVLAQEKAINNEFTGVETGSITLNRITGGWQNPDLIIIAARPSMGKTAMALHYAKEAAKSDVPVALFSLEMGLDQLNSRFISSETDYTGTELRTGNFDNLGDVAQAVTKLSYLKIYADDTSGIDISELKGKARRLKKKHKIGLIIVDYLQLVTSREHKKNREQEVGYVSRQLKSLAMDLNIPVIALSQLNRAVETRSDKIPQMSDLRESGAIEQDADMVCFIHRPEYYKIPDIETENGNIDSEGKTVFIIGKYRHGCLSDIVYEQSNGFSRYNEYTGDKHIFEEAEIINPDARTQSESFESNLDFENQIGEKSF